MAEHRESAADSRALRPYLLLARLLGAHALRGECKAEILTDREDGLASVKECWLLTGPDEQQGTKITIDGIRGSGGNIISLQGVETREDAEKLRGHYLAVDRSSSYQQDDGAWYVSDLIGCEVYDETRGYLGRVRELLQGNANDNLAVQRPEGQRELLIPMLQSVLSEVNIPEGVIKVVLPEGLWEIYED